VDKNALLNYCNSQNVWNGIILIVIFCIHRYLFRMFYVPSSKQRFLISPYVAYTCSISQILDFFNWFFRRKLETQNLLDRASPFHWDFLNHIYSRPWKANISSVARVGQPFWVGRPVFLRIKKILNVILKQSKTKN